HESTGRQSTLITGAKGGLGAFITKAFLAAGAKVVGVSRSIQASDFPHPGFAAMPAELSSGEAARKVADAILAQLRTYRRPGTCGGWLRWREQRGRYGRCHARQDAGSELPFGVLHYAGRAVAHATAGRRANLGRGELAGGGAARHGGGPTALRKRRSWL